MYAAILLHFPDNEIARGILHMPQHYSCRTGL